MIDLGRKTKSQITNIGNLQFHQVTETGLEGRTEIAQFRVTFYTAGIVRVHLLFGDMPDTNPYGVIATPERVSFETQESADNIRLITGQLIVEIHRAPFRVAFYSLDGTLLSREDSGLGISAQGDQLTIYRELQEGERFIGLGEKTGPLDRRGRGYQNWNTDAFAYGVDADPLYSSIPFFIGVHSRKAYGFFLDNSYKSHFNFGASNNRFSSISVDGGDLDYYFIHEESVGSIISAYTHLTGRMDLPPIWSIGYQQCRYSYYPQKEVEQLADKFRTLDIPADVIVLDIHYMHEYKIFTWDGHKFPDPMSLIKYLKSKGFEVVLICDPGIKEEAGYVPYETGKARNVFLKYPDGTEYTGEVWPGWCHFPDFTKEEARSWWFENLKSYTDLGIKGFWNDMNEIATWGQMLPDNIMFNLEGEEVTSRKGRNVYGMQMARSSYEGARKSQPERPFILTRAAYAGIQRYSAMWTGDNVANDEHMLLGVRLVNSLGLSGVPFVGYDVGGFAGNGNARLFARWIQVGSFSPFFRGHSMINSHDSEPWSYGEHVEEISRNYIKLRYKLMPYLYAAFREASQTGLPVCRSLAIEWPHEAQVYQSPYDNQYLFGRSILVAPVESHKDLTKVYLPEGEWYELFKGTQYKGHQVIVAECGMEQLPVFVRASAILPFYPETKDHTRQRGDLLEIHVYKGHGENTFTYYEDDGVSYAYQAGEFFEQVIKYQPVQGQLVFEEPRGQMASQMKTVKVVLHGFDTNTVKLDGHTVELVKGNYRFVEPISNFDPIVKPNTNHLMNENISYFTFAQTSRRVVIAL
jgi:alpha-glucosidase